MHSLHTVTAHPNPAPRPQENIIVSVKADDDDLRVEAARSEYRLECRLRPFTALHRRQVGRECAGSAQ